MTSPIPEEIINRLECQLLHEKIPIFVASKGEIFWLCKVCDKQLILDIQNEVK